MKNFAKIDEIQLDIADNEREKVLSRQKSREG
jgi:hypothetical protein